MPLILTREYIIAVAVAIIATLIAKRVGLHRKILWLVVGTRCTSIGICRVVGWLDHVFDHSADWLLHCENCSSRSLRLRLKSAHANTSRITRPSRYVARRSNRDSASDFVTDASVATACATGC